MEQAVIRDGSIDRWVVFGRTNIDAAYRLRLSASRALETQVVPIVEPPDVEVPIDAPHVVVESERSFYPAWSVIELGVSGRNTNSSTAPNGDLARAVAQAFPAAARLPGAVNAMPSQVERAVTLMPQPNTIHLGMRWHRVGHDVAISDSGIFTRTLAGTAVRENVTTWRETETTPSWVIDTWNPAPAVRRLATSDSVEAVIVGMASFLGLGVRVAGRSEWYVISASPQAVAATMLARWLGVGDAGEVSAFTDPKGITFSSVSNATDVSVRVRPWGSVEPISQQEHPRTTIDALNAWLPTAQIVTPELGVLPQKFSRLLQERLTTAGTRTALAIGAHVEEIITVEGGHVWRYETNLMPGQTDARRFDSITRLLRAEGVIDREGHFGPDKVRCHYCDGRICAICIAGLVSCDCCGTPICKRCVREPYTRLWLCPACAAMRPPTRSEARQHGRLLFTRDMLIGTDSEHFVVVEHAKHRWTRHTEDGGKCAIAHPSVSKFLEERLSGNSTTLAKS
ncbi:MAG: hypothetical protein ACRDTS_06145 [Mycobacterium sp.]